MMISVILGAVALVGFLMMVAGGAIAFSNVAHKRNTRPGIFLASLGLVIAVSFFCLGSGVIEVEADEVGVVFQRIGGDSSTNSLWPQPLGPGIHIIVPIINTVTIYPTHIQTYTMTKATNEGQITGDDSVTARTKDGQQTYIDLSVFYKIDPEKANLVHIKWQNRYQDEFVRPHVRSIVYEIIANYSVNDLYGGNKRGEIEDTLAEKLVPTFLENGLTLTNISLRAITFSDEFTKSIEAKQVAQQQADQAKQEADRKRILAKGDADAVVTAADGDAQANIVKAKGDAEVITLKAQADATALAVIHQQLSKNPQIIQWRYIEKLAGNISLIVLPSDSPFLLNLKNLISRVTQ